MLKRRTNEAKWSETERRWRISVQKDGQRRVFTSSTPGKNGKREAHAKADAWLDDGVCVSGQRVAALVEEYLEYLGAKRIPSSVDRVRCNFENYLLPLYGHRKIETLTEGELQIMLDRAFKHGSFKKDAKQRRPASLPLSRKTLVSLRSDVVAFIKYCRCILRVTALHPETLTIPKSARCKGKKVLQPQSLQVLFSVDTTVHRGKRVQDCYIFAYRFQVACGLRPGELIGIQYGDIKKGTLRVRRAVNQHSEQTLGKNENAVRNIKLTPQAEKAYQDQVALLRTNGIEINYDTPLFQISTQSSYANRWRRYLKSNGCPLISPYELRHTFVSIAKTLPDGLIKPVVGHSKNMDTYGIYGHLFNGEDEQTAALIAERFNEVLSVKQA